MNNGGGGWSLYSSNKEGGGHIIISPSSIRGEVQWPHGYWNREPHSGWSGPGSSPGLVLCSWARHFILSVPFSTQVYKWVAANLMLGITLQWSSPHPGGVEILLVTSRHRNWDKLCLMGHLAHTDFTFT